MIIRVQKAALEFTFNTHHLLKLLIQPYLAEVHKINFRCELTIDWLNVRLLLLNLFKVGWKDSHKCTNKYQLRVKLRFISAFLQDLIKTTKIKLIGPINNKNTFIKSHKQKGTQWKYKTKQH